MSNITENKRWEQFLTDAKQTTRDDIYQIFFKATFGGTHAQRRKIMLFLSPEHERLQDSVVFSNALWQEQLSSNFPGIDGFLFVTNKNRSLHSISEDEYKLYVGSAKPMNFKQRAKSLWDVFLLKIEDGYDQMAIDIIKRATYLSCNISEKTVYISLAPVDTGYYGHHFVLHYRFFWSSFLQEVFDGCNRFMFVSEGYRYTKKNSLTSKDYVDKLNGKEIVGSDNTSSNIILWGTFVNDITASLSPIEYRVFTEADFVACHGNTVYIKLNENPKVKQSAKDGFARNLPAVREYLDSVFGQKMNISIDVPSSDTFEYPAEDVRDSRSFSYWFCEDIQSVLDTVDGYNNLEYKPLAMLDKEQAVIEKSELPLYCLSRYRTKIVSKIVKELNLTPHGEARLAAYADEMKELIFNDLRKKHDSFFNIYAFLTTCNALYNNGGVGPDFRIYNEIISFEGISKNDPLSYPKLDKYNFLNIESHTDKKNKAIHHMGRVSSYCKARSSRLRQEDSLNLTKLQKLTNRFKGIAVGGLSEYMDFDEVRSNVFTFNGDCIDLKNSVKIIHDVASLNNNYKDVSYMLRILNSKLL